MPGTVQQFASTGYSYCDSSVKRVRNAVPLFDTTVQRLEPYIPPVIETADKCYDAVLVSAEKKVVALRGTKAAVGGRVLTIRSAAVDRLFVPGGLLDHLHSVAIKIVDRSEILIDRMLPPDDDELKDREQEGQCQSKTLFPRALTISLRIPVRTTRIVFIHAGAFVDSSVATGRWAVALSAKQQEALLESLRKALEAFAARLEPAKVKGLALLEQSGAPEKAKILWKGVVNAQATVVVLVENGYAKVGEGAYTVTTGVAGNAVVDLGLEMVSRRAPRLVPGTTAALALKEAEAAAEAARLAEEERLQRAAEERAAAEKEAARKAAQQAAQQKAQEEAARRQQSLAAEAAARQQREEAARRAALAEAAAKEAARQRAQEEAHRKMLAEAVAAQEEAAHDLRAQPEEVPQRPVAAAPRTRPSVGESPQA